MIGVLITAVSRSTSTSVRYREFVQAAVAEDDDALLSVTKVVKASDRVVFDDRGSYIENNSNGYRTYLRQENGSYFLDVWVKKAQCFPGQGS